MEDRRKEEHRRNDDMCYTALKQLVDARFETVNTKIEGMQDAVIVRTSELNRRLEELNELRKDVLIDRAEYIRKDVYEPREDALRGWMRDTQDKVTQLMTVYDTRMNRSGIISLAALIVSIIAVVLLAVEVFK